LPLFRRCRLALKRQATLSEEAQSVAMSSHSFVDTPKIAGATC
jgi:hypothetical protein